MPTPKHASESSFAIEAAHDIRGIPQPFRDISVYFWYWFRRWAVAATFRWAFLMLKAFLRLVSRWLIIVAAAAVLPMIGKPVTYYFRFSQTIRCFMAYFAIWYALYFIFRHAVLPASLLILIIMRISAARYVLTLRRFYAGGRCRWRHALPRTLSPFISPHFPRLPLLSCVGRRLPSSRLVSEITAMPCRLFLWFL